MTKTFVRAFGKDQIWNENCVLVLARKGNSHYLPTQKSSFGPFTGAAQFNKLARMYGERVSSVSSAPSKSSTCSSASPASSTSRVVQEEKEAANQEQENDIRQGRTFDTPKKMRKPGQSCVGDHQIDMHTKPILVEHFIPHLTPNLKGWIRKLVIYIMEENGYENISKKGSKLEDIETIKLKLTRFCAEISVYMEWAKDARNWPTKLLRQLSENYDHDEFKKSEENEVESEKLREEGHARLIATFERVFTRNYTSGRKRMRSNENGRKEIKKARTNI